jgi:hypothetical protein
VPQGGNRELRVSVLVGVFVLVALGALAFAQQSPSPAPVPGAEKSASTKALGLGATVIQDTTPANQLQIYLDGFHFVHDRMDLQEEAHHYCNQMSEEFAQCTVFDGNGKDAKLIGVEHIVSARLYQGLPEAERRMWHPHDYEVKAGLLIAPGIPQPIEHKLMEKLVGTWGKTWHVWHTKHAQLPVGQATLMMGFTKDGQLDRALLEDRDRRFSISTDELRKKRADIPAPR